MKTNRMCWLVTALLLTLVALLSCKEQPRYLDLDTVHIDQTKIKNQYQVGFCWAYSVTAMLESLQLKNGVQLDLSEEYLGFYKIYESIIEALRSQDPVGAIKKLSEGNHLPETIALVEKYGVVPESIFNRKFDQDSNLGERVKKYFLEKFKDPNELARYRSQESLVLAELGEQLFGATPPKPTDKFTLIEDGKEYTPLSLLKDKIGFSQDDYYFSKIRHQNFDIVTHYIKVALMKGYSIPLGTRVFDNTIGNSVWKKDNCSGHICEVESGHMMLVVDFVTHGGRGGRMPHDEIMEVFHKPLTAMVLKNSHGLVKSGAGRNQKGESTETSEDTGFIVLDRSYIDESMTIDKSSNIRVMIPKLALNDRVGADLKASFELPDYAMLGDSLELKAILLDELNPEIKELKYYWSIEQGDNGVEKHLAGPKISYTFNEPGRYLISLKTQKAGYETITTKSIYILKSYTDNLLERKNITIKTGNIAKLAKADDGKETIIAIDTANTNIDELNHSYIYLPSIKMQKSGAFMVNFRHEFSKPTGNNLYSAHDLQISLDRGKHFQKSRCRSDKLDEEKELFNVTCFLKGQEYLSSLDTVNIDIMIVVHQKHTMFSKVSNISLSYANAIILDDSKSNYLPAAYPENATFRHFSALGEEARFAGIFGDEVHKVHAYVDGKLSLIIGKSDIEAGRVTFKYKSPAKGVYAIRLVGVKDDVESSYIEYELYVTGDPIEVAPNKVQSFDLRSDNNPFIANRFWHQTKYGLSASAEVGVSLSNNQYATSILNVDLSQSKNTKLFFVTFQVLESDYDFFYVKVSNDGGSTFDTVTTMTGANYDPDPENPYRPWKLVEVDLSKYDGFHNVLIRFDGLTDPFIRSDYLVVRELKLQPDDR